jgi:hypothetical protein
MIHPLELSGSNKQRYLVAKQEKLGKIYVREFAYKYLFHTVGIFNIP